MNIENQVKCSVCGWDKFCLRPPRTTEAEATKRTDELVEKAKREGKDPILMGMISTLITAGDIGTCPACSVFIDRLTNSPKLAQGIRDLMKEWQDD